MIEVFSLDSDLSLQYVGVTPEEALISTAILKDGRNVLDPCARASYKGKIVKGKVSISISDLAVLI
jgi:hypothetical protein